MDPIEAGRVCKTLAAALGGETDAGARRQLAWVLAPLAGRMDLAEAGRVCGPAARALADALGRETDAGARSQLAWALAALAGRMDLAEAGRICRPAARASPTHWDARKLMSPVLS